jgi:exodeoxyribonuclease VII small subunit
MSRPTKRSKEPGFETALGRLEEIVRTLEEGDLPLETSLRLYEEGVALMRQCAGRLEEAQRRIEVLGRGGDGAPALRPLETSDTGEPDGAADAGDGDSVSESGGDR